MTNFPHGPTKDDVNRRHQCRLLVEPKGPKHVIPPERRWTVAGYSRHCPTCGRFTRSGGGCPGLRPDGPDVERPLCHEIEMEARHAMWDRIDLAPGAAEEVA